MALFSSCFYTIVLLHILHTDAFKMYQPSALIKSFVQKRSTPVHQQCVLVRSSSGFSVPAAAGGNGDQSPLLPGPSRGDPGTIQAQSACGDIGATGLCLRDTLGYAAPSCNLSLETISPLSGPNGAISWMTCGINSTGWTPSFATVSDIITADLSSALQESSSPFQACNSFLSIIEKYSAQFKGTVN